MSDFPDSLPAGWSSYDTPPGANEEFGAQPTWLFARDAHDVGVQIRPVDANVAHGEQGFRVDLTRGTPDEAGAVETLDQFDDREDALAFAREVMEACDDRYERGELEAERLAGELR